VGGFALILRLSVAISAKGLSLRQREGAGYLLTYLGLNGLGIRDLHRQGDDVLILAGPTMDLDGPFALYRWRAAFARRARGEEVLRAGDRRLEFLFDFQVPERRYSSGAPCPHERPEGMALHDQRTLLVVHDRPAEWRLQPRGTLAIDVIELPRGKRRRPR
jgi:hypothetical protein